MCLCNQVKRRMNRQLTLFLEKKQRHLLNINESKHDDDDDDKKISSSNVQILLSLSAGVIACKQVSGNVNLGFYFCKKFLHN